MVDLASTTTLEHLQQNPQIQEKKANFVFSGRLFENKEKILEKL